MTNNFLSLRQRLLLWLLPPIILLTALWIWAVYAVILYFTNLAYDRTLDDSVRTLAGQVQIGNDKIMVDLPLQARQMLEFDPVDKVFFSVSDKQGRMIAGNRHLPTKVLNGPTGITRFYDVVTDGQAIRLGEYQMNSADGHDIAYVHVAETMYKREILAKEVLVFIAAPQLLFLLGIVGLVWYGVGHGIAPLQRIRDAIARRSHADLSPLDERGLPAEVYEQVHVINELMQRLGKTIASQQRFIADATHQLRTPIAVLRAQTQLALRTHERDELYVIVKKMDASSIRLTRLANQLLNLSRAESGLEGAFEAVRVRLAEIVEDEVAALVPMALKKNIDINVDIEDRPLFVLGDRRLLGEMMANLIDNAVHYTQPGGQVRVLLGQRDQYVVLTIADNGPGIPESECERVLERFYRGAGLVAEGSGLGLAISREVAELHEGTIRLLSGEGEAGLMVIVEIPVSA